MPKVMVHERDLRSALRTSLAVLLFVGLTGIGYLATPTDVDGHPLLLSPRVAAIARYQRQVQRWAGELRGVDVGMRFLLESETMDLFAQDSAYQDINRKVDALVSSVDETSTPGSLIGLRDLVLEMMDAHKLAAEALGRWISAPSTELGDTTMQAIDAAEEALSRVYNNPWVIIDHVGSPESTDGSH